jgi:hypothetical protein
VVFLQVLKPARRFDVNVIKTTKAKKIVEPNVTNEPRDAIEFHWEKASG